jgi:putative transcriptional regulator
VASPKMEDARFREALIYIARHDAQGAFGIVINRPQGVGPIEQILRAYRLRGPTTDMRVTIYWGGPVESGRGFVLHTTDYGLNGALMVAGNLAVSRIEAIALAIAEGRGPRQTLMAYGYTNWGPGQLDREITAGDWYVVNQDEKLIFNEPDATKWRRAFGAFGMEL